MDPRRHAEPEPVEIVLVPLDAATDEPGATDRRARHDRPPPAGAGTLPALGGVVGAVLTRVTAVPDPPLLPGRAGGQPWSDQRLHRLVRMAPWDAAPALRAVLGSTRGHIRAAPERPVRRGRTSIAWRRPVDAHLVLEVSGALDGPVGGPGALHLRRWGRATPVELTLEPWSAHQSDLCLQPRRGRFGRRLPRGYYDAAHRVMDELWHLIERASVA